MELNLPLERQIVSILASNREDSFATQRDRAYALFAFARMLHAEFGLQKWANLGAKHIAYLVEQLKEEDTGSRKIESKLTHLRWLVRKIGKANLVPKSNKELDIAPGPRKTRAGKIVPDERFRAIVEAMTDRRMRLALHLGRHLGMRFREAMLFRPGRDFDGERVWIKRGSKGGRPRYLWVHNARQREVIADVRTFLGADEASLTPREYPTFEKWRQHCYRVFRAAGLGRGTDVVFHDLRRTYACERMDYLVCVRGLSREDAAAIVARELGHSRTEILEWYLADSREGAA